MEMDKIRMTRASRVQARRSPPPEYGPSQCTQWSGVLHVSKANLQTDRLSIYQEDDPANGAVTGSSSSSSYKRRLREERKRRTRISELEISRKTRPRMGKYMRKCKGIGEIAVMEVSSAGVRTRARTLALATAAKRKRPPSSEFRDRGPLESPSKSRKSSNSGRISADRCPSPDRIVVSRCSSNGSSDLVDDGLRSSDPEVFENTAEIDSRERRELTPCSILRSESDDLESTARPFETKSRRKWTTAVMPSDGEIEAFFSTAEKSEQKRFADK
ncbi:hypothetical protein ACLOJK_013675 [Asimina triloba]